MEADFSMCLGLLMSYKEPEDILTIIKRGELVRDSIINGKPYEVDEPFKQNPNHFAAYGSNEDLSGE